ncbi:MAG: NAD(P)H-dependent oxidoreductase [Opitutae bacterium]|nr:NAD(P)H-dependent oxidoreductase [Opitutae bacterium]
MITIIVGTNRTGSVSAQVADFVAKVYDELGINNRVLDIADLPPETFSPNAYVEKPPRVVEFTEQILASSGLFVITPEYNGSMSGALKLFIDMLPFPESFEDRPVSYIGISAGQFGGLRPVEHLQQVFGYRNALNFPRRVFIPAVGSVMKQSGGLEASDYGKRIREQAKSFAEYCRTLGKL